MNMNKLYITYNATQRVTSQAYKDHRFVPSKMVVFVIDFEYLIIFHSKKTEFFVKNN